MSRVKAFLMSPYGSFTPYLPGSANLVKLDQATSGYIESYVFTSPALMEVGTWSLYFETDLGVVTPDNVIQRQVTGSGNKDVDALIAAG